MKMTYKSPTDDFAPKIFFSPDIKKDSTEYLGDLPRWNLKDLYPSHDSKEILTDMERLDHESLAFRTRWKGNLENATNQTGSTGLGAAISEYEKLSDLAGRIYSYAYLLYSTHLSDQTICKFHTDTNAKITDLEQRLIFFTLEINDLDNTLLEKSYNQDLLALKYSPWIKNIRKYKKHLLSDELECLFSDTAQTGSEALKHFFSETLETLRFKVNDQKLPLEKASTLLLNPDRKIRESSGKAISKTFEKNSHIFSFITNTLAKDREIQDKWRKYENVSDSRHLSNDIEPYVIESLVQSVKNYYPKISHRYYSLKKQWLKLDKMYFWDRSAPLLDSSEVIIPFEKARDITLASYAKFSPQMSEIAEKFFSNNWIDAPQCEGKGIGAFSHGTVPSSHPYISLNYSGKSRDVTTLAHELGHGIHQVLSAQQGALMANAPLILAETASIFGEALTFDSLIDSISNEHDRKILLTHKIEDSLSSIIRQIAFYDFELRIHTERRTGSIPIQRINEIWLETQKESLGPAFELDNSGYDNFWMMIPHFIHSSFYVYSYSFGNCLVNSLYEIYKSNTVDQFQKKYLNILRAGNSKNHSELLQPLNIDLSDPNFWNRGLQAVERMIDDLEQM
ncbi:oligoendopeptidase F [Candidatus Liberibacter solanacearum CLso-ZC1]|uniref:Oligoendopeptidase F n=1 Tax=Liberibacter solanacearum (strain CLso-ZC1) TaxID=658172 RepID=E4UDR0_LIBSC|nr:M3 family oligoendopeptidase [Candidatus Liberibacter solanacearum]ADR52738.1 oligoendopeptidase F [Candidatus Liberibacter solanacearum CLso-ZC1]